MTSWADIQRGIFAGESGGDYNALFGYANRPGGLYQDVRPTQMTINEILAFQDPSGPYGQYVGALNKGVVSTPVGAYQIVGTTLRDAVNRMGLSGQEVFTPEMQDRIGRWIYEQQGTGAWEGYKGPQAARGIPMAPQPQPQRSQGLLEQIGLQRMGTGGPQGDIPFHQRDRFKDFAGRLAMAANTLRQRPDPNIPAAVQASRQRRSGNRTAEWLRTQPNGEMFARMIEADPNAAASVLAAYQQAQAGPAFRQVMGSELGLTGEAAGRMFNVAPDGKITQVGGAGTTVTVGLGDQLSPYQEAQDKAFAELALDWKAGGLADLSQQRDTIAGVIADITESEEPMSGPTIAAISKLGLGAILTPEATDVQQRVASVVQRTLKETLGAQFTQKEGEQLIARAYNPALSPEMNLRRLGALFDTVQQTVEARQAMIDYADREGTLRGYTGPVATDNSEVLASELSAAMDAVAPSAQVESASGQIAVGTIDSGYRYIGGPPHLESSWEPVR